MLNKKQLVAILLLCSVTLGVALAIQPKKHQRWEDFRPKPESLELQRRALEMIYLRPGNIQNRDSLLVALELTNRAIQLDSGFFSAYRQKAEIYVYLGMRKEALLSLLEYKPVSPEALINAGMLLEQDGDTARANEHYERALELNLGEERPYYRNEMAAMTTQCFLKIRLHRRAEAIADWRKFMAEHPLDSADHAWAVMLAQDLEKMDWDKYVREFWRTNP